MSKLIISLLLAGACWSASAAEFAGMTTFEIRQEMYAVCAHGSTAAVLWCASDYGRALALSRRLDDIDTHDDQMKYPTHAWYSMHIDADLQQAYSAVAAALDQEGRELHEKYSDSLYTSK